MGWKDEEEKGSEQVLIMSDCVTITESNVDLRVAAGKYSP